MNYTSKVLTGSGLKSDTSFRFTQPQFNFKLYNNEHHQKNALKLVFYPNSLQILEPGINKKPILDTPTIKIPITSNIKPKSIIDTPNQERTIECPTNFDNSEKLAVRMLIIRRKKMNKHKLKKLRKRQKYEIRRIRQRRELRKEKEFQLMLFQKVQDASAFKPDEYVAAKLDKAFNKPLSRYWNGKRLPLFIIRQLHGLDPKINYKGIQRTQD